MAVINVMAMLMEVMEFIRIEAIMHVIGVIAMMMDIVIGLKL